MSFARPFTPMSRPNSARSQENGRLSAFYRPHTTKPMLSKRYDAKSNVMDAEPRFVPIKRLPTPLRREKESQTDRSTPVVQKVESKILGREQAVGTDLNSSKNVHTKELKLNQATANNSDELEIAANAYYQRLLERLAHSNSASMLSDYRRSIKGAPQLRTGSQSSSWRHITHCIGYSGNNIMYIDGTVKEDDCRRFPPHGYPTGFVNTYHDLSNRLGPRPLLSDRKECKSAFHCS